MTTFELEYRNFKRNPHRHQLYTTFQFIIEEVFENLETEKLDITTANPSAIIDSIINKNFGNNFYHQNGPNK